MSEPATVPVEVRATATVDTLESAFRGLIIALGSYGVGRGWFDAGLVAAAVPVLLILGPIIWGAMKARAGHARQLTMAQNLPDSLAVVKGSVSPPHES